MWGGYVILGVVIIGFLSMVFFLKMLGPSSDEQERLDIIESFKEEHGKLPTESEYYLEASKRARG